MHTNWAMLSGMEGNRGSGSYWRGVIARAWRETVTDSPMSSLAKLIFSFAPLVGGFISWRWLEGTPPWVAGISIVITVSLLALIAILKLASIPPKMAKEEADKHAAQLATLESARDTARADLNLAREIAPNLSGEIISASYGGQSNIPLPGSSMLVCIGITNIGTAPSIAMKWSILIEKDGIEIPGSFIQSEKDFRMTPRHFADELCLPVRDQLIDKSRAAPIPVGGAFDAWAVAHFPVEQIGAGWRIKVRYQDVRGKTYTAQMLITGNVQQGIVPHFPGMTATPVKKP